MSYKLLSLMAFVFSLLLIAPSGAAVGQEREEQPKNREKLRDPPLTHNLKIARPDLIIKEIVISDDKQRVTVTVANICKGRSKATHVRIVFRQNEDVGRGQIRFETEDNIPALAANATVTRVLDISSFASGRDLFASTVHYASQIEVDFEKLVKEVNEYNNSRPGGNYTAPQPEENHCGKDQ